MKQSLAEPFEFLTQATHLVKTLPGPWARLSQD